MKVFHKPSKGRWYYEIQIGPLIFGWLHDKNHVPRNRPWSRAQIWKDRAWWRHNKPQSLRRKK